MTGKKKKFHTFSLVAVIVVILVYILSIVFALIGNIGLTVSVLAFNSCFVVVLYFVIRYNKNRQDDDESNNEISEDCRKDRNQVVVDRGLSVPHAIDRRIPDHLANYEGKQSRIKK